jgi:hypothetical protein
MPYYLNIKLIFLWIRQPSSRQSMKVKKSLAEGCISDRNATSEEQHRIVKLKTMPRIFVSVQI